MNKKTLYHLQVSSASISLVSAALISGGILKSGSWRASPYHRIVLGISLSDIIRSLSIILGPFLIPSSSPVAPWAIGNDATCRANGFMYIVATYSTPMYMFGLCMYTALKIKRNGMHNQNLSRTIEKLLHAVITVLSLGTGIFGLATKTINPSTLGGICLFESRPTGCRFVPGLVGSCDAEINKYIPTLMFLSTVGMPFVCIFGIICCMGTICWHVIQTTKISVGQSSPLRRNSSHPFDPPGRLIVSDSSSDSEESITVENIEMGQNWGQDNIQATNSDCQSVGRNPKLVILERESEEDSSTAARRKDIEDLVRLYCREIIIQACYFVLAFFVTYSSFWTANILFLLKKKPPLLLSEVSHALYPLGGFFNVLAYTRPKIRNLRINYPTYSWLGAAWYVIKSGCDIPRRRTMQDEPEGDNNAPLPILSCAFGVAGGISILQAAYPSTSVVSFASWRRT